MLTNTKDFCKATGYPVTTIRMLCRIGEIPFIPSGKAYLFDPEDAESAIRRKMEENARKRRMKQSGYDFQAEVRKMRA